MAYTTNNSASNYSFITSAFIPDAMSFTNNTINTSTIYGGYITYDDYVYSNSASSSYTIKYDGNDLAWNIDERILKSLLLSLYDIIESIVIPSLKFSDVAYKIIYRAIEKTIEYYTEDSDIIQNYYDNIEFSIEEYVSRISFKTYKERNNREPADYEVAKELEHIRSKASKMFNAYLDNSKDIIEEGINILYDMKEELMC